MFCFVVVFFIIFFLFFVFFFIKFTKPCHRSQRFSVLGYLFTVAKSSRDPIYRDVLLPRTSDRSIWNYVIFNLEVLLLYYVTCNFRFFAFNSVSIGNTILLWIEMCGFEIKMSF